MSSITVTGLQKAFDRPVLRDVDLCVEAGEVTAILGASGTGKSTLLRCVTGLLRPDDGVIALGDRVVDGPGTHTPAHRRRVGLVPQDGSLFPHLNVADNVGYGLRGPQKAARVAELLDLVGLPATQSKRVQELSGGMQQRVAVARALAVRPAVVVLDEPFSALDTGLREALREDVLAAIRADGTTALLVTHDQQEAFAVADRVAVMMNGTIVQHATPQVLYTHPVSLAVARFVGDTVSVGTHVFRPEQLSLDHGRPLGPGLVTACRFHGHDSLVTVDMDGFPVQIRVLGAAGVQVGQRVQVQARAQGLVFGSQPPVAQDGEAGADPLRQTRIEVDA